MKQLVELRSAIRRHELAKQKQVRAMFRFAKVQSVTRLTGKPLLVPFVGDTRIFTGAGMTGANGNHYLGLHEFADMAFLLHFLRPEDLFIDIGANVGSYTILASGVVGACTVCYEPVPATITRLRANLEANGITNRVNLREVCLGNQLGAVTFTTGGDTVNHIAKSGEAGIEVPMHRLDDEPLPQRPRLIKVDAEGADEEVLRGAEGILSSGEPMALLVETVSRRTDTWLTEMRFQRFRYHPPRRSLEPEGSGANNHLYIRQTDFAQTRLSASSRFKVHGFADV